MRYLITLTILVLLLGKSKFMERNKLRVGLTKTKLPDGTYKTEKTALLIYNQCCHVRKYIRYWLEGTQRYRVSPRKEAIYRLIYQKCKAIMNQYHADANEEYRNAHLAYMQSTTHQKLMSTKGINGSQILIKYG